MIENKISNTIAKREKQLCCSFEIRKAQILILSYFNLLGIKFLHVRNFAPSSLCHVVQLNVSILGQGKARPSYS